MKLTLTLITLLFATTASLGAQSRSVSLDSLKSYERFIGDPTVRTDVERHLIDGSGNETAPSDSALDGSLDVARFASIVQGRQLSGVFQRQSGPVHTVTLSGPRLYVDPRSGAGARVSFKYSELTQGAEDARASLTFDRATDRWHVAVCAAGNLSVLSAFDLEAQQSWNVTEHAGSCDAATPLRGASRPPIRPAGVILPTATVSPSTGQGFSQIFTFNFYNPTSALSITNALMLFNSVLNGSNSCYVIYSSGTLGLVDDAGTGITRVRPGTTDVAQNSACSLSGTNTSISANAGQGSPLQITVNLTFTAQYGGMKSIYTQSVDAFGNYSGWVISGLWSIPSTNVAPFLSYYYNYSNNSISGTPNVQFQDANGASTIATVGILINGGLDAVGGCYVIYLAGSGTYGLHSDNGSSVSYANTGTLSNSQCILNVGNSSAQINSQGVLTVTTSITFKPAFYGYKYVYAMATDAGGLTSGWNMGGSWVIPSSYAPPQPSSISPNSGMGGKQTFTVTYTNASGVVITSAAVLFNPAVNAAYSCYVSYTGGKIVLVDDTGATSTSGVAGTSQTLSNSQCSVDLSSASVYSYSTSLQLTLPITFSTDFAGTKNIYGYATADTLKSEWVALGNWTVPGSGLTPIAYPAVNFYPTWSTFRFYHPVSAAQIGTLLILVNSSLDAANACYVQYSNGKFGLVNDNASAVTYVTGSGSASNSQCTISNSYISLSGSSLQANIQFSFKNPFNASPKYIFTQAISIDGKASGWAVAGPSALQ